MVGGLDRTDWSVYIGLRNAEEVKRQSVDNPGIVCSLEALTTCVNFRIGLCHAS
jgi:hypothetical protein